MREKLTIHYLNVICKATPLIIRQKIRSWIVRLIEISKGFLPKLTGAFKGRK